jgi:menaquinone reductase, iron-sulfur cluster-binding subunit
MARWGMIIDLDRCSGCQACTVACKAENNIPSVGPDEAARGRVISWMQLLPLPEEGGHGHGGGEGGLGQLAPRLCMHCDDPPCTKVCPVYATYKNPEGIVGQIYPRCIGCRFCMAACPYTAKSFNWRDYSGNALNRNPDVSVRPKGVVEKCTFCHHRRQKARDAAAAEGRTMQSEEYQTACAEVCPAKAITFGDLDDHQSEASRLAKSPRAFRLLEELGTKPKVIYLKEGHRRG